MRTLRLIAAVAVFCASGPAVAFADPEENPPSNGHTCISTDCKGVYDPGDLPPGFEYPSLPPPPICMQTVYDESVPPEDQWDGCVLP